LGRLSNIDSYGYDVHEVHTSEGGARIVQTHGSGTIEGDGRRIQQQDESLNQERIFNDNKSIEQRRTLIEEQCFDDSRTRAAAVSTAHRAGTKEVGFVGSTR
uniref:Type VI secretion system tip protein VgrG n=1 Tax=Anisakis simplex TaxID=6269 RepID=A0A0M3JMM2_ANISI